MEFSERLGYRTEPQAAQPSVGLIETASIAKGYEVADAVAKRSPVQLLWARTVSPGHYVVLFAGEVEETGYALERGAEVGAEAVIDQMLIPNVHVDLVPAIRGPRKVDVDEALGVVELSTVATTVLAADRAAKAAAVDLIEVRLAMHLGGRGSSSSLARPATSRRPRGRERRWPRARHTDPRRGHPAGQRRAGGAPVLMARPVVTREDIEAAAAVGSLEVGPDAVITQAARDLAERTGVVIRRAGEASPEPVSATPPPGTARAARMALDAADRCLVTAVGRNRVSILAEITARIAELGGNVHDISQRIVGDYFSTIFVVDLAAVDTFAHFKAEMQALSRENDYKVVVQKKDLKVAPRALYHENAIGERIDRALGDNTVSEALRASMERTRREREAHNTAALKDALSRFEAGYGAALAKLYDEGAASSLDAPGESKPALYELEIALLEQLLAAASGETKAALEAQLTTARRLREVDLGIASALTAGVGAGAPIPPELLAGSDGLLFKRIEVWARDSWHEDVGHLHWTMLSPSWCSKRLGQRRSLAPGPTAPLACNARRHR